MSSNSGQKVTVRLWVAPGQYWWCPPLHPSHHGIGRPPWPGIGQCEGHNFQGAKARWIRHKLCGIVATEPSLSNNYMNASRQCQNYMTNARCCDKRTKLSKNSGGAIILQNMYDCSNTFRIFHQIMVPNHQLVTYRCLDLAPAPFFGRVHYGWPDDSHRPPSWGGGSLRWGQTSGPWPTRRAQRARPKETSCCPGLA